MGKNGKKLTLLESIEERLRLEEEGKLPEIDWRRISLEEREEHERVALGWLSVNLSAAGYYNGESAGDSGIIWASKVNNYRYPVSGAIYRKGVRVSSFKKRILYTIKVVYEGYIGPDGSGSGKRIRIEEDEYTSSYEDIFEAIVKFYQKLKEFENKNS